MKTKSTKNDSFIASMETEDRFPFLEIKTYITNDEVEEIAVSNTYWNVLFYTIKRKITSGV